MRKIVSKKVDECGLFTHNGQRLLVFTKRNRVVDAFMIEPEDFQVIGGLVPDGRAVAIFDLKTKDGRAMRGWVDLTRSLKHRILELWDASQKLQLQTATRAYQKLLPMTLDDCRTLVVGRPNFDTKDWEAVDACRGTLLVSRKAKNGGRS